MHARVFVCLSKQARDKFQPLHPLQKFCSEEGQDGKFGKQVRRGLRGWGSPSVLVQGELRWEPRISLLLVPRVPRATRGGGAAERTGRKLFPYTSGILCAWRQHGWRDEERISPIRAVSDKLWQPLHPFLWGTEISCLCLGIMPWFVSILV